ncbi:RNA polymerase-associated protein RapA [Fibrobacter sp. UBA4309]|uniref:RNA polymerase-associated protein RapA n=1 Tax=Fibrobacter sp. UBA4309 TaxID=1946537 RepID=UPI0025B97468|nr:RNA polymerase-associated protein RapA [Fibrobacter sp. UBA4309]
MRIFKPGQRYVSQSEPDLGLGIVSEVQGRTVKFLFPLVGQVRLYRTDNAPVDRFILQTGETAKSEKGVSFVIESLREAADLVIYVGRGGREMKESDLTSKQMARPSDLFRELNKIGADSSKEPNKDVSAKAFDRRRKAMELLCKWLSSPVRGMIGPRVSMIPHQYYLCYRACSTSNLPRLMLSDEVGLGKTIEAGMIWHALKARGRIDRTLIIVPETLKHQWMIEMKRRFNHLFTLVDEGYVRGLFVGVAKDETKPNPFMQSNDIIVSIEFLMGQPALIEDLLKCSWDMTIIDEAHHLVCEDGFTSHEYMLANAVLAKSKGVLLLTGTPLQLHPESQFNRLKMLDPARFADYNAFIKDQETYRKLVNDLSKLPTDPNHQMSWDDLYECVPKNSRIRPWLEQENSKSMTAGEWMRRIVDAMGTGSVVFRNTRKGVGGFPKRVLDEIPLEPDPTYRDMVEVAAERDLEASTDIQENGLLCTRFSDAWALDERFVWLKGFLKEHRNDKILLICESITVVLALEALLTDYLGEGAFSMFHENMTIMARDKAAANFSKPNGANLLIASEIGSEGRNFQFSHHLVLFDLPLDAALVEQRIGRLDRIGQTKDIIVHVPYVKGSGQEVMFRWYNEGLNAFGAPLMSGGELFLKYTDSLIEALADPRHALQSFVKDIIPQVRKDCEAIRKNIEKGRDRLLEYNSRNPEKAKEITDEILRIDAQSDLRELMLESLHNRGLDIDKSAIDGCSVITQGPQIEDGTIAGMPSRGFVAAQSEDEEQGSDNICLTATFDRDVAMVHDEVDFLSLEHPLAQGTIDYETGANHGVVACCIWPNSGLRGLMMQYNFAVELPVPEEWGMSDLVGPRYVSALVDATGSDQSEHLADLAGVELRDVNVPQGNKAVDATIKFFAKEGLAKARQAVAASAKEYAEKAADLVEARSEQEYQRMNHLLTMRGKAAGNTVLQQMRKNVGDRRKVVANPQLRLDAIRLLVCR